MEEIKIVPLGSPPYETFLTDAERKANKKLRDDPTWEFGCIFVSSSDDMWMVFKRKIMNCGSEEEE